MDSLDEKKLFEENGWQYDYIARVWEAPDGKKLSLDQLVFGITNFGEYAESSLKYIVRKHGNQNTRS